MARSRFRFRLNIQNSISLQLTVIAALIVFNFSVVQFFDSSLSEIEKTIDIAEKNSTYSQQIPYYAKLIHEGKDEFRLKLGEAIANFETNLNVLKNGGVSPAEKSVMIAKIPAELIPAYFTPLEQLWRTYKENAETIKKTDTKVTQSSSSIENIQFTNALRYLIQNSDRILERNNSLVSAYLTSFDKQQSFRDSVFISVFVVNIISILGMFAYVFYNVSRPISKLNEIENIINEGNFDRQIDYRRNDELGDVAKSINTLFRNLKNATEFIINIGEGKLSTEYQRPTGTDAKRDRLGTALLEMRDKMRLVNEQDGQRNWVSEGLAKFADIFQNKKDSQDFTYIIISELVKYVEANQGGLFIVEDEQEEDSHLELVAAYAFQKRKYLNININKGEGLIGEVYREGNKVYMTDVPEDYVNITSGLGDANPRCILMIPLKLNDEIYGVLELASFNYFEPYKIEFIEKLGESIASTFASVKNSQKNEKLLKDSLQLSEQMKAQEEEMRQNLEELVATQEEVQRKNQLIEEQKRQLEETLEDEKKKVRELEEQYKSLQIQYNALQKTLAEVESENQALQEGKTAVGSLYGKANG